MGPLIQQFQTTCPDCQGKGKTINEKDKCQQCDAKRVVKDKKVFEVHVDPGMKSGMKIKFTGEANQEPDGIPGDFIVVIEEKDHPFFKRSGEDLQCTVKVDLLTALAGGSFSIKHLDDRILVANIQPGEVVKPGDVKCIRGSGMPQHRRPFDRGNLYVQFDVTFPPAKWTSLDKIKTLEKILPARSQMEEIKGDVDTVELVDVAEGGRRPRGGTSYAGGEGHEHGEDEEYGRPRVQCAQQ